VFKVKVQPNTANIGRISAEFGRKGKHCRASQDGRGRVGEAAGRRQVAPDSRLRAMLTASDAGHTVLMLAALNEALRLLLDHRAPHRHCQDTADHHHCHTRGQRLAGKEGAPPGSRRRGASTHKRATLAWVPMRLPSGSLALSTEGSQVLQCKCCVRPHTYICASLQLHQ
jgi:hypothetical protein